MYHILYVDDEQSLLEIGKLFIEQSGQFSVDIITSAPTALDQLNSKKYDAIISDYQMPEMNGIEFLKRIRISGSTIPFIIFTGRGREEVVIQALNEGADFYLQKGGEPKAQFAELANMITQVIRRKKVEEALTDSEERYRIVVEDQTEFITRFLPDGTHVFVNEAYCRYFGLKRNEILGHRFRPRIPAEDQKRMTQFFKSLTLNHPVDTIEHQIIMADGSIRWLWWSDRAIFDPSGTIVEYQSVGRDITESKRIESELRISYGHIAAAEEELRGQYDKLKKSEWELREIEKRYRRITEGLTDYIYTVRVQDGRAVSTTHSAACVAVTSYTAEEFAADPYLWIRMVFDEDRDHVIHHFSKVLKGEPVPPIEHRIVQRDGQIRWVRDTPILQLDADGRLVSYDGIIKDITVTKQEDLRASEIRYRTIFENTGTATVLIEENTVISIANAEFEQLSGYLREELEGKKSWTEFVKKEDLERMLAQHHKRRDGQKATLKHYEFRFVTKTGEIRNILLTIDVIPGTKQSVASLMDITERKKTEEALLNSERKFRAIFDQTFQFIGLMTPDGTLVEANRTALKFSGIKESDVLGKPFWETPWWTHSKELQEQLHRAVQEAAKGEFVRFEVTHQAADGSLHYVDFSLKPVMDDAGRVVLLIPEGRDITDRKRAEEALSHSETRYRELIELLPQTVFEIDLQGKIISANPVGLKSFGYSKEDLEKGLSAFQIIAPNDHQHLAENIQRILQEEQSGANEYLAQRKDGSTFPVITYSVPIIHEHTAVGLLGVLVDITERKQAEDAVKLSERRLTDIINFLPDATFAIDKKSRIITWNKAMEEMTGTTAVDMLGKGNYEYAIPFYSERKPILIDLIFEDIDTIESRYVNVQRNGDILIAEAIMPDTYQGTGTYLWGIASPLYDNYGKIVGAIESIRDITRLKQTENALKESEEKYRALTENTSDILFSTDMTGIITYVSPQVNKYGFLEEEMIGKSLRIFIHPADVDQVESKLSSELKEGAQFVFQFRILDKWGTTYWFEEKSSLRLDLSGKPIGIYGILRDVTERQRVEDAIGIANKKLNLMNQITRHDILNTITGLFGCVDMAMVSNSPEERKQLLNDIRDLARVTQRHITFTREYQEVGVNQPQWQNVNDLINKVAQNFAKSGIMFSLAFERTEIYADPLLEKVFYNLMDNAIRYGETLTTISIYSCISDKRFSLVFEDNGVGIEPSLKHEIFKRGVGKNTGMGLFLTAEILAITGIFIEENGIFGKGARFEIQIPNGTWRFAKDLK
jgi:PAS domain S-box-containing protein